MRLLPPSDRWTLPIPDALFKAPAITTKRICQNCKGSGNIRTRGTRFKYHRCTTCAGYGVRWAAPSQTHDTNASPHSSRDD